MLAVSQFVVIDGFVSVVWLAANMLLFFAALRVAERVFPDDSGANKVLNVSVSAISILTVVLLLLGAASILTVVSMLVGVSAVSLALLWRIKRREIGIKPEWRPRSTTSLVESRRQRIAGTLVLRTVFGRLPFTFEQSACGFCLGLRDAAVVPPAGHDSALAGTDNDFSA